LLTINLEGRPGLHGAAFTSALHQLLPALGAYALSFLILGQLWLAHHRIFGVIARVDYVVLRRNLLFLGLIAIMPFPVRLQRLPRTAPGRRRLRRGLHRRDGPA